MSPRSTPVLFVFGLLAAIGLFAGSGCASTPAAEPTLVDHYVHPAADAASVALQIDPPPQTVAELVHDEWDEWFQDIALPAVSADGTLVALAVAGADGGRGNPNLKIEFVNADLGQVIERFVILSADELDDEDPALPAKMMARLEPANALLAQHRWIPIEEALTDVSGRGRLGFIESGEPFVGPLIHLEHGLSVTFEEPRLSISVRGRVIASDHPEWTTETVNICDDAGIPRQDQDATCFCQNPATLWKAWFEPTHRILLVEIGYLGHDTCWEPDRIWHLARLPKVE